jgi:hypothetical protein
MSMFVVHGRLAAALGGLFDRGTGKSAPPPTVRLTWQYDAVNNMSYLLAAAPMEINRRPVLISADEAAI